MPKNQLGRRPVSHPVRAATPEKWLHLIERGEGVDGCPTCVARYYAWPALRYVPLGSAPTALGDSVEGGAAASGRRVQT